MCHLKDIVVKSVETHAGAYTALSDAIWDHPEVNFHEDYAAGALRETLVQSGFALEDTLVGMPNAFRASYGSGKPVIAFLGEFDALSAMSQKAGCAVREALNPGAPGHGCGHNLLGVGALGAAIVSPAPCCRTSSTPTANTTPCSTTRSRTPTKSR